MPNTTLGHLPTVEDSSVGSGSTHASNANSVSNLNTIHSNSNSQQPRMKRSNYLSVMAGATKSSEDLVAMLSRPTPGAGSRGSGLSQLGGGGGSAAGSGLSSGLQLSHQSTLNNSTATPVGGRSNFFDLRRKNMVTPVPAFEGEFDDGAQDKDPLIVGFGGSGDGGGRRGSNPRPLPSLRSALRMSSRTDVKAMTNNAAAANAAQKMKKNTSVQFANTMKSTVSFSNNTKAQTNFGEEQEKRPGNASFLFDHQQPQAQGGGGPQAQGGQGQQARFLQEQQLRQFQTQQQQPPKANYTAAMMMRKSQSIASPQMMLAHQNSIASGTSNQSERTANETFAATSGGSSSNSSGAEGNASFPIYLAQVPAPAGVPTSTQSKMSSFMDARRRCQSMAGGMGKTGGMTPVAHARPSSNGLNLTFKEMLDVGDGEEGDLGLRSRNHQWKDFQSFSSNFEETNPMMKAMAEEGTGDGSQGSSTKEGDGGDSTSTSTTIPLSGSKRTLTPSSVNTVSTGSSKNSGGNQGFPPAVPNSGGMPHARTLMGSHRASVSVNDLAVLRRAAGRMKMNNPAVGNSSRQTTTQPGQMLGGDMLNRISGLSRIPSSANSEASQSGSRASGSGGEAKDLGEGKLNNGLSPLAQMMARSTSRGALNAGGGGGGGDGFANPAQRDLFFQKFNMAMSSSTSSNRMSSMGNENSASRAPAGLTPMQSMLNRSSNNNLSGMGGMGRRVRTVGAGLAYGRANMTNSIDYKSGFRMSKFDLGDLQRETSRLSEISNEGSTAGGKNEEWNLS